MSNPIDQKFVAPKTTLTREQMEKLSGIDSSSLLPSTEPSKQVAPQTIQGTDASINLEARIREMEANILKLKTERNSGVKITTPTKKTLDFSKLSEKSVYDLTVPIEAIPQGYLDPTQFQLRDPNYVARLVSTNIRNMGVRKQAGFTFVTKEDLDFNTMPGLDIEPDENGQYRYIDTVLMKIPKEKYYAALRANHLRAMAVSDQRKAHEAGKAVTEKEFEDGVGNDYAEARSKNLIEVYSS